MADFTDLIDLAAERLGGAVLAANDEFFAPKEALLRGAPPEWREGMYTDRGKWMDGWETRRRRTPGHDWAIVRLGVPGVVRGVVIDTSFFRGNYPERASLDAYELPGLPTVAELTRETTPWMPLLEPVPLAGDARNRFEVDGGSGPTGGGGGGGGGGKQGKQRERRVTHVRLNIFPDGGIARLRVHGEARPEPRTLRNGAVVDLAAMELGGFVVACSDMFFGHRQNLILPGRSTHMGDGWETRRRRGPGHDWTIVRLAARGVVERIEIDTDHFKGNAPDACTVESCDAAGATAEALTGDGAAWTELLARTKLQPHTRHRFEELKHDAPATHVRLAIHPDGGVARLRVFGRVTER